jgi:hypothetical protein
MVLSRADDNSLAATRRNDIAQFVNAEVERLIKDGKLLRNSKFKDDMKEMIIHKVTEDAAEM